MLRAEALAVVVPDFNHNDIRYCGAFFTLIVAPFVNLANLNHHERH
jgi:hypothetical protein